jgi:hypothetical protein
MDHAGAKARILSLARRSAKALLFHSTITFMPAAFFELALHSHSFSSRIMVRYGKN